MKDPFSQIILNPIYAQPDQLEEHFHLLEYWKIRHSTDHYDFEAEGKL